MEQNNVALIDRIKQTIIRVQETGENYISMTKDGKFIMFSKTGKQILVSFLFQDVMSGCISISNIDTDVSQSAVDPDTIIFNASNAYGVNWAHIKANMLEKLI